MKPYTITSFVLLVLLSLVPPIEFVLKNPEHPTWLWMIAIAAFFGMYTLFIKTDIFVKIIAIAGFLNCFFSVSPYISFTSYCSLILCCYFYICCTRIEDWSLVFKAAQSILLLNTLLLVLEFFHKDTLMDWGQNYINNYGILGHHMQMGSFAVIISALLLSFSKINIIFPLAVAVFCNSSWSFISAGIGVFVYFSTRDKKFAIYILVLIAILFGLYNIKSHKIQENLNHTSGRIEVWEKSFELGNKRPLTGWGIGTYKEVFFPLSRMTCVPWKTAHNFIAELDFEVGHVFTACLLFGLGWLAFALFQRKLWIVLSGLAMIFCDALVHFPDRMIQTVPIIIIFLAYARYRLCHQSSTLS